MITTKILAAIRRMNTEDKLSDIAISEALGLSYNTVRYYRLKMGLPTYRHPHRHTIFMDYTAYDSKTGKILVSGPAKECAAKLGINIGTFYAYASKSRMGQHGKYEIRSGGEPINLHT